MIEHTKPGSSELWVVMVMMIELNRFYDCLLFIKSEKILNINKKKVMRKTNALLLYKGILKHSR